MIPFLDLKSINDKMSEKLKALDNVEKVISAINSYEV